MTAVADPPARPAVVVLPGLAATAVTVGPLVRDLETTHRVIAVELPGHGAHRPVTEPPSLASAVRHLRRAVTTLGERPVILLGWSLGATVAYRYLEQYGDTDVAGLISVEQSPCLLTDGSWPYAAFGVLDRNGANRLQESITDDYGGFAETLVTNSFAAGATAAPALVTALVHEAHRCDREAVRRMFADAATDDWRSRIAGIRVPTLLIHGELSQVYPSSVGRWLQGVMPTARLDLFPRSGHLPFLEEREAFHQAVRDFVVHVAEVGATNRTGVLHA